MDETAGTELVLIVGDKLEVVVGEEENLVEVEMEDDITLAVGVRYLKLVDMLVLVNDDDNVTTETKLYTL